MPATGQYRPDSLPSRLRDWFTTHPGLHRCRDVAEALNVEGTTDRTPAWKVANECGRQYRQGVLIRARVDQTTYYGAPADRSHRARADDQEDDRQEDDAREEGTDRPAT